MGKGVTVGNMGEPLALLLSAFAGGNASLLSEALVDEPYLYLSTHGNAYTRDDLAAWFKGFHADGRGVSCEVVNDVVLHDEEDHAWQYANAFARITQGQRRLTFVGTFVCELVSAAGKWLIRTLRFEMQGDDAIAREWLDEQGTIHIEPGLGDRSLIEGWKLANDRVGLFMDPVPGQGTHVILAEFDAPWLLARRDLQEKDVRQRGLDLFARFCFAQDFMCFKLLSDVLADDAVLVLDGRTFGAQDGVLYLKQRRQGWPLSFTAGRPVDFSELPDRHVKACFAHAGMWDRECVGWRLTLRQIEDQLLIERLEEMGHE